MRAWILPWATAAVLLAAACGPLAAGAPLAPAQAASTAPLDAPAVEDTRRPDDARGGGSVELRHFASPSLGRTMPYWLYLPQGYERGGARYPVLYMLHGMGGSHDEWRAFGIFDAADRLIRTGAIAPLIIVLPQGDRAYWVDHAQGGAAWGRYTAEDLVSEVDSRYRTIPRRSGRAIGGISMGAHGAVQLALNHPQTFGVVGAHSIALRLASAAPEYFGGATEFAERDPMTLIRTRAATARSLELWVDVGEEDPWAPRARQFHGRLQELAVEHEWHEWSGDHSATYWTSHVDHYLRFYDSALARCAARTRSDGMAIVP